MWKSDEKIQERRELVGHFQDSHRLESQQGSNEYSLGLATKESDDFPRQEGQLKPQQLNRGLPVERYPMLLRCRHVEYQGTQRSRRQ